MSEYHNRHGKREAAGGPSLKAYWQQHRAWVAGLDRGQKIRYRLFQAVVVICAVIIVAALALRSWIRLPEVPGVHLSGGGNGENAAVSYDGAQLPEVAKSGRKDGYYTFLVAGQDVVSGSTDTMILFTYDTKEQRLSGISLLRDTMINTSASSKRLNAVFARNKGDRSLPETERVENGMAALKGEVSKLTGIYPDFYVLVQWEAIGELVDAIGGVYFDVPFDMDYDDPTPGQDLHIHQKAGYRLLEGQDAMEVIRFRKNNEGSISLGDSGRTEIQRDFLIAVIKECLQPDVLLKLPTLAQIFLDNVNTDLSIGNLLAFAQLAVGMDVEEDVSMVSMPWTGVSYHGASMVVAQQDELLALLNGGLNPYPKDIQASDLQLMYIKSGGGFGVTNAVLADSAMGYSQPVQPPAQDEPDEPEVVIEPEDPVDPENPEDPENGAAPEEPGNLEQPDGPSQGQPGEGENQPPEVPSDHGEDGQGDNTEPQGGGLVDIDPNDIFPEIGQAPSQDIRDGSPVLILPARPQPVEPAA